jgi:hypothetical protein
MKSFMEGNFCGEVASTALAWARATRRALWGRLLQTTVK